MDTIEWGAIAPAENEICQVRIDEKRIVVSYEDDDGPQLYRGEDLGDGHFRLRAADGRGDATLHRFPGGEILEGYWEEDGDRGFWRIRLES